MTFDIIMTIIAALTLFATMFTLAAIPSASVALVVTRSATLGVSNGVAVAAGIVIGDLIFVSLAILGMSILAETLERFFVVLKFGGGAYLIWMGIALIRSKDSGSIPRGKHQKLSLFASFISGLVLTLGDLKAILFYANLFPAFVDMAKLNVDVIITIVLITVLTVGGIKILYAFAASRICTRLEKPAHTNLLRRISGCLMIGSGSFIIAKT